MSILRKVFVSDENGTTANVKENSNTHSKELLVNLEGHQCLQNSTIIPLGIDGVFTGSGWQDTLDYGVLSINVFSDQDSAVDGLEVQWSYDGITLNGDRDHFTILAGVSKTFTFGPAQRYYRIVYTNGPIAQMEFHLSSLLRRCYVKPSSHRITDMIVGEDDAELIKSVLTGRTPSGLFSNVNLTSKSNLKMSIDEYGDTPSIDAFARLRISEPYTLFDSKQLHDKQPLFWDETIGGSATSVHVPANACTTMAVTASADDYVIRQTKIRPNYQPGKSQLIFMTFYGSAEEGTVKRVGLFDGTGTNNLTPNNGIFFESDGSTSWNICKAGVITESVNQTSWNLDKLDGTGTSALTLNRDSVQIAIIDFEWLGAGRVRVGFVINGLIVYVHQFNHANYSDYKSVYMSTPNLPLRYSIQSDGTGGGTFDHICSTVISEGGIEKTGVMRSADNDLLPVVATVAGTSYALLGIKLKSTYNDITILPTRLSALSVDKDILRWRLILNPTVAGTFTYNDLVSSAVQVAIGASANTVTGGVIIASGYIFEQSLSSEDLQTALTIGTNLAGASDALVLCFTSLSGNKRALGSITWRELL